MPKELRATTSTPHVPGEHPVGDPGPRRRDSPPRRETVADDGVVTEELAGGRRLFIDVTRSFVTGHLPLPFAVDGIVLELLETVDVDHWVMSGLRDLERRGFAIAVADVDGETEGPTGGDRGRHPVRHPV